MTDTRNMQELTAADPNHYWKDAGGEHTQVDCPGCGQRVDIDGPLEDAHFVFALRWSRERLMGMERSNLGTCPVEKGYDEAVEKMRFYLGVGKVYYRGHLI